MGGRIRIAESVILIGTTFLVELPLIAEHPSEQTKMGE
jgi:hypothetical protein